MFWGIHCSRLNYHEAIEWLSIGSVRCLGTTDSRPPFHLLVDGYFEGCVPALSSVNLNFNMPVISGR